MRIDMKKMQTPEDISSDRPSDSPEQLSWLDSVRPDPEARKGSRGRPMPVEAYRNELAETSFEGIYIIQNGVYRFINRTAAAYLGYSPEELIGRKAIDFVHPEDRAKAREVARLMLRQKSLSPYEFRIVDREGREFSILETIRPILFEGKPAALVNAVNLSAVKGASEFLSRGE
jgi:PAS domain S-box-containing protein